MKIPTMLPAGAPGRRGFSLIEMIGVLAVIAVTAAMILPALIRQTDATVATQESTLLQSFATALQNNVQRNGYIPTSTNWVSVVATELGMTSNSVALNVRNQPRILLVDTNGFGSMALPYMQTNRGTPNVFTNSTPPRYLILSSLGAALPVLVGTNGMASSSDFNALWNTASGTIPTNSTPWTSPKWPGNASDLNIQRLDLAYSFAHLILSNNDPTNAPYSIDGSPVANVTSTNTLNAFFLITTPFNLYLSNTNMEASQILLRDSSWVFSGGGWRRVPPPAPSLIVSGTNITTTLVSVISTNADDCCHQFNCQSFCTNALSPKNTYCTAAKCCSDMTNYMNLYQQYANSGFNSSSCRNNLQSCCTTLNNDCANLCSH